MKGNSKATTALVLLDSTPISATGVKKFSEAVAFEFGQIARADIENAIRGVLVGIGLNAVKRSTPRGTFEAWKKTHLTKGGFWTEATALKNASFYMRLALHVLEDVKPSKPELLALTASGAINPSNITLEGNISKLIGRLRKLIGDRSLDALLSDYGIKNGSGGGGSSKGDPLALTAGEEDPLMADTAEHLMGLRAILLDPETMKRFSTAQLRDIDTQLASALEQFRQLKSKLRS